MDKQTRLWRLAFLSIFIFLVCSALALPLYTTIILIGCNTIFYIGDKSRKNFVLKLIVVMPLYIILAILSKSIIRITILYVFFSYINYMIYDRDSSKSKQINNIVFMVLPLINMIAIEIMQSNVGFVLDKMFLVHRDMNSLGNHVAMWVSYIMLLITQWIVGILFKKIQISLVVSTIITYILGIINMVVLYITSSPLLPSDIYIMKTAMNVIEQQKIDTNLIIRVTIAIIAMIITCTIIIKLVNNYTELKKRIVKFTLGLVLVNLMLTYISSIDFLTFRSNIMYGFVFHFIIELRDTLKEPVGYIETDINTSLEVIENKDSEQPNIIFIMSEAFSDLEKTYKLETTKDVMPYFRELMNNHPNGVVYSSVIGNNTVSSEFESLSGITTAFSDKGSNIYQKYISENLYTAGHYYKELGYKTGILHGSFGANYNRANVYNLLKYDNLVFEPDFSTERENVRKFVSDRTNFNEVLNLIENTEEPLFLMNITMQNHGGYEDEAIDVENKIELDSDELSNLEVNNYLSLINQSDIYLKEFLQSIKEPTIVMIYGDHQPMIKTDFYNRLLGNNGDILNIEEQLANYEVPYLIWSNFETNSNFEIPEKTSMNYLHLILCNYLNSDKTEWLNLLDEVRECYPIITGNFIIDKNGNIHDIATVKARLGSGLELTENEKLLQKYQFACYELVTR